MRIPKIFGVLATAAILFATTAGVSAEPKAIDFVEGVNWTKRVITVRGVGIPPKNAVNMTQARAMAEQAAKSNAYRKMAEMVNGVRVEGEVTVEKMITIRDVVKTKISATIKGAKIVDSSFLSDGSCVVYMQVPIFGVTNSLAGAVFEKNLTVEPFPEPDYAINPSIQQYDKNTPLKRRLEMIANKVPVEETFTPVPDPYKPPLSRLSTNSDSFDFDNLKPLTVTAIWQKSSASPVSYEKKIDKTVYRTVAEYASLAKGDYTGLVVDCRGLELQPVMSPVIKNSKGTKIYGHKNLDIDKIISMGMADYSGDLENVDRAGDNPLVVKATSVENFNSTPVLEVPDSNRVLIENHATHFLKDLKVVFLLDE